MKRAKTIEAVLCVVAILAMVVLGLWTLQPKPRGYFSGQAGFSVSSGHPMQCDLLCQILLAYAIGKALDGGWGVVKDNNGCTVDNCGGGGGGAMGPSGGYGNECLSGDCTLQQ